MQIDLLVQLEELMKLFGLKTSYIDRLTDFDVDVDMDQGLRKFLKIPYDYGETMLLMEKYLEEGVAYVSKDSFEEYYISFLLPEKYWRHPYKGFWHMGPYIRMQPEWILDKVMKENKLPAYLVKELQEYYYSVPLISSGDLLEGIVVMQLGYLWEGKADIRINRVESMERISLDTGRLAPEEDSELSMSVIEERYRYERLMMEAIRTGELEKVIEVNKNFERYRLKPRSADTIRNTKNLLIVQNTLFRKAVEQAAVHPMHIDRISELFARKVENSIHINELVNIYNEMQRKYCLLVRNHSLKGYSLVVRDALNYIDFHLEENLSRGGIAEQINVNANYLSTQFKKEVGKTITDCINEKRIHKSLILLTTTDLPIHEVAAQVGIFDENYFSRLFKKYQNMTALQYRNMVQSKL